MVSASETYRQAHYEIPNSSIYRKSGEDLERISDGLPASSGTFISILESNINSYLICINI
jgi:hypothetical protein